MFYHFLWQSVYRAFVEQNSLPISQNMSNPDPAESSSEDQLRKISSYMRQKLTASHRQWLATQSEALNTSSEQVMSDVLSEWVVRHRETVSNGGSLGDFLPEALEEFISRHREEFLPVLASG
jgi:archaellum biogenesis protein FlaJ (TadC family)